MPSGIADYSFELVPMIAEQAKVDLYCPRPSRFRKPSAPPGVTVLDPRAFDPAGYDAVLYHLGNNPYHEFVYEAALRHPGVAVFHDFVLHHLLAHMLVEAGRDEPRYEDLLRTEHGPAGSRLAALRLQHVATDFEKFVFPLNGHVAQASKAMVVHSLDSRDKMRRIAPGVPCTVIPHHAQPAPPQLAGVDRTEARRRLGLPQDAFIAGHFGFITRPKQPAAVIGGFARLVAHRSNSLLVMVGADNTGGGLQALTGNHGVNGKVASAGYVDLTNFYLYLRAVDTLINLRYPSAGESSGTLARAMGEGRVAIVNNAGSFAELPSDAVLKVEIDGDQAAEVGAHLIRLSDDPQLKSGMEDRARTYGRTVLDSRRCAELYLDAARRSMQTGPSGPEMLAAQAVSVASNGHGELPPIAGGADPRDAGLAMASHRSALPAIDDLAARTLPLSGTAVEVDLLYRMLLRRPAEDGAMRSAQLAMAAGDITRSDLIRDIVASREFNEVQLIEQNLTHVRRESRPFTVHLGSPVGQNTTERVVEIPWALSRAAGSRRILDLGYAYASGVYLSALLALPVPELHGLDWSASAAPGMLRTRGDLRRMPYREGSFDLVICISTIEHIGRDNTGYGLPGHTGASGDVETIKEIERVLQPNGRLLITVPFGRREEHSWFLQYDAAEWQKLVGHTTFWVEEQTVFRLEGAGWQPADGLTGTERLSYARNGAPAAQGVLCASLRKPA
jgi:SAM-dependent methyltransferase/glycosyltransferase involved in cell wall biosynthesis